MIEFNDNILTVRVELEPGIYFFEPYSATGKTRLYHHMCDMYNDGELVLPITYSQDMHVPAHNTVRLALFDRYDMYSDNSEYVTLAEELASNGAVVLVDLKSSEPVQLRGAAEVVIELQNGVIRVHALIPIAHYTA